MNKIKDKWSALSMQQRADLIKLYINSGITNINDIRKHYNSFDNGGPTEKDTILMYSDAEGNLYDALPGVVDIRGLNRGEVKRLAQEIAGRDTHEWDVTNRELASGNAIVQGKHRDQENRFNRIFAKQYKKNLDYSRQIERAKRAGQGDIYAMQSYITTGANEVAPYFAPLLGIPAASVLASTGVVSPVLQQVFKTMMNPASAKTTLGALAATGLDASGVASGAAGMGNIAENWMRGDFAPSDIPAFALNAMDVIPGAAAVNATIGAAQDARRIGQAAKYINDAVNDINTSRVQESPTVVQPQATMFETPVISEGGIPILGRVDNIEELLNSRPRIQTNEIPLEGSDLDIDIDTFLRRAPEDMGNVEPSRTMEETSILRNPRREPEPFDWDAFEAADVTPIDIPRIGTRNYIERTLRDRRVSQSDIDWALNEYDDFVRQGGQDSEFWDTAMAENIAALPPEGTHSSGIRRIDASTPESDPSIAYGSRRITRSEIERYLREDGASQYEIDLVLDDFDTASNIGDGESFWRTSSGQRMNNLISRQGTDFIDLGIDNRLYREDLERTLRSAGYEQDVISEALLEFDQADIGMDPYTFVHSRSGRIYDRLRRGIGRNEIELADGNIVDVDEASRIMRNLGYNENAINRLINNSVEEGYPLHTSNPSPRDLTDAGLRIHINSLDEDTAIYDYANLLSMKKRLGTEHGTGRYKEYTRTLNQGDERSFKVFAERMSKIFDDNVDFADLSEDNYVKIKNYLRSKGILSGDIEHMNWFQMDRSLPKDGEGNILVTEADGTIRPLMFGERPQYSTKGQIQAGRLAMQMYDDIPRGYAVAEMNTSVDSEKLKLRGATSRYGFEPGQFSVEISNSPYYQIGNNLQHERLYLRDLLKYKDQLPESEQIILDALLNGKFGSGIKWEDLQGTKLLDFIRAEYSDLTNRLVQTLSVPWKRIKGLDPRDEIQNAPMPSYTGNIDSDIKALLRKGNYSPFITRQPIYVVKHEDGGPLKNHFGFSMDYRDYYNDTPSNYVELTDYQLPHSLERNTFDAYTAPYIQGWNAEDIDYLYSRLGDTGFAPEAVMYALGTESSYNPYAKSKISSAIGLGQLTKGTLKSLYPKDWEDIYDQYINEERSVRDVIDDAVLNLSRINKNITSERDNLDYGRLKVNLLAPNASLDNRISGVILKSLTKDQKKKVTNNFTYRDLMNMYQEEFDKKFK